MNKKNNNKGFTLAELLIVVAIIAVLVAIAIPVFTSQLEKSREATDAANIRAAYAEVVVSAIDNPTAEITKYVSLRQQQTGWQNASNKDALQSVFSAQGTENTSTELDKAGRGKSATVTWNVGTDDGYATVTIS